MGPTICGGLSKAIQFALQAGAHLAARNLASQGAIQHADNAELCRQAEILAPAKIIRRGVAPASVHQQNRDWLRANEDRHRGQWVALRNGELLATAESMDALIPKLDENRKGILLTVV